MLDALDACRIGLCDLYDSGSGVFGLILGVAIGVAVIILIQRIMKNRRDP